MRGIAQRAGKSARGKNNPGEVCAKQWRVPCEKVRLKIDAGGRAVMRTGQHRSQPTQPGASPTG